MTATLSALAAAPAHATGSGRTDLGSPTVSGLAERPLADAELWLLWHRDVLLPTGLDVLIDGASALTGDGSFVLLPTRGARARALPGRFDAFVGEYEWPYPIVLRHRGRELRIGALHLRALDALRWALVDAHQHVWLVLGAGHPRMSQDQRQLNLSGAELRIGAALSKWLGAPVLQDQPLATVIGRFPLADSRKVPIADSPVGCPIPARWPGTLIDPNNPSLGHYRADVRLIQVTPLRFLRCRQLAQPDLQCDGPGGVEGEVALAPDAVLQNSGETDAADVPWYPKFLGTLPPYGNDQHPYLVWNLYREDPDGYLLQIGRSGLKHAFVTINNGCTLGCPPPPPANANQVLYPNCSDVYSAGTNDTVQFIGPRSELIPAQGLWARCGSVFDPDCDGVENTPSTQPYQLRLVTRESDIDPAMHPASRYFEDAWYVVRDDINIDNGMAWREVQASFVIDVWNFQFVDTELQNGPMVARWTYAPMVAGERSLSRLRTVEGEFGLGARVEQIGPALWRYRYVLANLDYARTLTSGTPPNLQMQAEHGLNALAVPLVGFAAASNLGFRDGDPSAGNDWNAQLTPSQLRWSAPDGTAELRWSNLISVGFDSTTPPGYGQASVELAGSPGAANASLRTLVPGGEMLADGFE